MKRTVIILSLIFALAIALSVSIPTMAATSDTVVITGTVAKAIDVAVTDGPIALGGDMVPGGAAQTTSGVSVTVQSNTAWTVNVKADNSGKMLDVATNLISLTNAMTVTGGDLTSAALTGSDQIFETGTKTASQNIPVTFSQTATMADEATNYDITVTFTGTTP